MLRQRFSKAPQHQRLWLAASWHRYYKSWLVLGACAEMLIVGFGIFRLSIAISNDVIRPISTWLHYQSYHGYGGSDGSGLFEKGTY